MPLEASCWFRASEFNSRPDRLCERHLLHDALGVDKVPGRVLLGIEAVARHFFDWLDDLLAAQRRLGRGVEDRGLHLCSYSDDGLDAVIAEDPFEVEVYIC